MPKRRRTWSVPKILAALFAVLAMISMPAASHAEPDPGQAPWVGLPDLPCVAPHATPGVVLEDCESYPGGWAGLVQRGVAGSAKAKQWLDVPPMIMATHLGTLRTEFLPGGGTKLLLNTWAWFVSPKGSQHNYGESPIIPVRTVAFGSIPVEAELQVAQRRDSHGDPIPISVDAINGNLPEEGPYGAPAKASSRVLIKVKSLRVDGVDIGLGSGCVTSDPATLTLTSEYISGDDARIYGDDAFTQHHGFIGQYGGTLFGTLDVPAFSSCQTKTGEDLSPLLTATVSGKGNPITVRTGMYQCFQPYSEGRPLVPPAPGETTPEEAHCFHVFPDGVFPRNPNMKVVPDKVEFPDKAPEATDPPEFDSPPLKTNWPW